MNRLIISTIYVTLLVGCFNKNSSHETISSDAICISESDTFHNCKTFELKLKNGKLQLEHDGRYENPSKRKGSIQVDENCTITTSQFIEIDDQVVLFNNYDCGPEGYNDIVCINTSSCKTLWTIDEYFGFTPSFFKIDNDIIIPGHYTIGRFNIKTGKKVWLLDIEKKYKFSRIEKCSIDGHIIRMTGATFSLNDSNGWKLIDLSIDMTTGQEM